MFISGCGARSCHSTNAASITTPKAASAMPAATLSRISTTPLSRLTVATPASARPRQSSGSRSPIMIESTAMTRRAMNAPSSVSGTTTKKIERQPNASTRKPPRLGPSAGASTTPKPNMLMALPCSRSSNTRRIRILGSGCMMPAAAPSATRMAIITP
ncbi:hypothetical protein D3C81_1355630 [compost metagenome]